MDYFGGEHAESVIEGDDQGTGGLGEIKTFDKFTRLMTVRFADYDGIF